MTMYVSKVTGFDNPCGPLVFSKLGLRDTAVKKLRPGDRVIFVGTKGVGTPAPDRNRVLGMMEPSIQPVDSKDYAIQNPGRWPYGLSNHRAWEFSSRPPLLLDKVAPDPSNQRFGSAAGAGIVGPLYPEEEAQVLAHHFYEIPLLEPISADREVFDEQAIRRRGAPVPAEGVRRGIMHMRRAPAFVYWFRLEVGDRVVGHKIGWAFDWRQRLRQFNSVSLNALGGLRYKSFMDQQFNSAREAFRIEQQILEDFDGYRHPSNREVLTGIKTPQIDEVWHTRVISAIFEPKRSG
jgi:hypothetical protein